MITTDAGSDATADAGPPQPCWPDIPHVAQGSAQLGTGVDGYAGYKPIQGEIPRRANGVYISMVGGKANAYSLNTLQERCDLFVTHNDEVYQGMIVGENARDNDLAVNPTKEKKLTNMRATGSDENILLKPPRKMDLEAALEYIEDDELVEVTPTQIRLRKMLLTENDRKRQARKTQDQLAAAK